jgi:hypothetical protein
MSLDGVVQAASDKLGLDLKQGAKAAVISIASPSDALSDYVLEELSLALVNGRRVTVVDRKELDVVRAELKFQLSGEVSDESAQAIGKMLGAQTVITGALVNMGSTWRFRVKAISVESAALESAPAFSVSGRDSQLLFLLGGKADAPVAPAQAAKPVQEKEYKVGSVAVA